MLRKPPRWLYADGKWERREVMGSQANSGVTLVPLLTTCVNLGESLSLPEPVSSSATWLTLPILQTRRGD